MTQQELLKQAGKQLNELNNRFKNLTEASNIHLIEVDIVLSLLRDIYQNISMFKDADKAEAAETVQKFPPEDYSNPGPVAQPYHPPVVPEFTPPAAPNVPSPRAEITTPEMPVSMPEPVQIFNTPLAAEPEPAKITQQAEIVKPEEVVTQQSQQIVPNLPETQNKEEVSTRSTQVHHKPASPQPELFGNGNSVADKLKGEATTSLNEKISTGKSDTTLADKFNLTPINDIRAAIGINEKFQFINELFDGSAELYNEAIALLNNCASGFAASQLLADYQQRNAWAGDNKVFLRLKEFVIRRYLNH